MLVMDLTGYTKITKLRILIQKAENNGVYTIDFIDRNCYSTRKMHWGTELCFDSNNKILASGYLDSAQLANMNKEYTVPTGLIAVHEDQTHFRCRLDYIFISEPLKKCLKNFSVLKNKLTDQASDHYPVIIELEK